MLMSHQGWGNLGVGGNGIYIYSICVGKMDFVGHPVSSYLSTQRGQLYPFNAHFLEARKAEQGYTKAAIRMYCFSTTVSSGINDLILHSLNQKLKKYGLPDLSRYVYYGHRSINKHQSGPRISTVINIGIIDLRL